MHSRALAPKVELDLGSGSSNNTELTLVYVYVEWYQNQAVPDDGQVRKHVQNHNSLLTISISFDKQLVPTSSNMQLSIATLFLPIISAFAPTSHEARSTTLNSYESAPGATAPIGYWDPLSLTSDKGQELFDKARVGEVKNGRAAMLGVIGYIVPEIYRFPGELAPGLKFADIPNGIAAINVIPGAVRSKFNRSVCHVIK